jgi:hypothetical protein
MTKEKKLGLTCISIPLLVAFTVAGYHYGFIELLVNSIFFLIFVGLFLMFIVGIVLLTSSEDTERGGYQPNKDDLTNPPTEK